MMSVNTLELSTIFVEVLAIDSNGLNSPCSFFLNCANSIVLHSWKWVLRL